MNKQWSAESLSVLATGYWQSQTLLAAVESGLLEALPATAPDAAANAALDPRVTSAVLEALVGLNVVYRTGDLFTLDPSAAEYLLAKSPKSLIGALRFNTAMYHLWAKLPDVLKSGVPAMPPAAHLGADPSRTRGFVLGMHSRALALLPPVADAIDLSHAHTLLDVGSGPGTLGRMLAERNPHLHATLIDLPAVSDVAAELTAHHPARNQITHLPGDYFSTPLPGPFDAITYCGALHQHAPDQAAALIAKLAHALPPAGRLIIVDLLADPTRTAPPFSLLFGVNMTLVSPTSHMHSTPEVRHYLTAAGLHPTDCAQPTGNMYTIVTGMKR